MIFIGNDVIDLSFQDQLFRQFKNSRLNQKIFSAQELAIIVKEDNLTLLRRWTMKEAGYKAYQRLYELQPKFNPASIHTEIRDLYSGFATIGDHRFKLKTEQNDDLIYTYIDNHQYPQITLGYRSREDLIKKLSDYFSARTVYISKDSLNIPSILIDNKSKPISLTSHGSFQLAMFPLY